MAAGKHASWTPSTSPTLERRWCGVSQSLCSVSCCKSSSQCCEKPQVSHPGRSVADTMHAVYYQPCLPIAAVLDTPCMIVSTACHCSVKTTQQPLRWWKSTSTCDAQHHHGLPSLSAQSIIFLPISSDVHIDSQDSVVTGCNPMYILDFTL